MTPLYPTFQKRINDAFEDLIRKQVTPWSFMTIAKPFRVTTYDGRTICYENIEYFGSPQNVFWGRYIEPFIEAICIAEISTAVSMAKEKNVNTKKLLIEIRQMLYLRIQRVYISMADVDRRLRGKGYPEKVPSRPIENEFKISIAFLDARIRAELEMWKPNSALEKWYENNKFWRWIIEILKSLLFLIIGWALSKYL